MAIDVGSGATNRSTFVAGGGYTRLDYQNKANADGVLTSFQIYAYTNLSSTKMGTFSGSGTNWDDRDYETIGSVTSGSTQTFTGLNCDVSTNDILGIYIGIGTLEADSTAKQSGYVLADKFGSGSTSYTDAGGPISLYATGISTAAVTTDTVTNIFSSSCMGNGNITDTGGSGSDVTERGFCYKAGSSGDPTTADSTVKDTGTYGTGSYSKSITGLSAGTAYRVRAYVVNIYGTFYGTTKGITTTSSTSFIPSIMKTKYGPFGPFVMSLLLSLILNGGFESWLAKYRRKRTPRSRFILRSIKVMGRLSPIPEHTQRK